MSSTDNTGLGLFDDTASAVGNFPSALRGYDRTAVDDYVRTLEANVVQSRRHAAQVEQQVSALQDQLNTAQTPSKDEADAAEPDYSNLGGRANDILRLAQEQARELVTNATVEAERVKEQARREADTLRNAAAREGNAIKTGGAAEIDQLRTRLQADLETQVPLKAESDTLLAAARRQADSMVREAEHHANTMRQQAGLDSENLRRTVEREAAEQRQHIAAEREKALTELSAVHEDAQRRPPPCWPRPPSTTPSRPNGWRPTSPRPPGSAPRPSPSRSKTKLAAVEEAEARVATAKKQAQAINERTQQEFAWRKQQLKRETELLHQRKQAVLSQLASLSALAEQTASAFPDLDDPSDLEPDGGDQTILRPEGLPPAGPDANADNDDEVEIDGDATVLVSPADTPGRYPASGQQELNPSDLTVRPARGKPPGFPVPRWCRYPGDVSG